MSWGRRKNNQPYPKNGNGGMSDKIMRARKEGMNSLYEKMNWEGTKKMAWKGQSFDTSPKGRRHKELFTEYKNLIKLGNNYRIPDLEADLQDGMNERRMRMWHFTLMALQKDLTPEQERMIGKFNKGIPTPMGLIKSPSEREQTYELPTMDGTFEKYTLEDFVNLFGKTGSRMLIGLGGNNEVKWNIGNINKPHNWVIKKDGERIFEESD